jgi:homoserine O-acetyltransferase
MSIAAETVSADGGTHGEFLLQSFTLLSGARISPLRLSYTMYGQPNTDRSNVVLILPGTSNTRHGARGHIGPGRAFDTRRYCVVSIDALGGGDSSQPGDGPGADFPAYSVADMVRAQHALALSLTDGGPLAAVGGASMGAFQALEWALRYPHLVPAAVLLVPAARAGQLFQETVRQMRRIIELDPAWENGRYRNNPISGLRTAGCHYFPWTVTDSYLESAAPDTLAEDLRAVADNFAGWDAWSLIRRYEASSQFDAAAGRGSLEDVLASIHARLLLLPCLQDRLLGVGSARLIHRLAPRSDYVEINSPRGHLAWRPIPGSDETTLIWRTVSAWLAG